MLRFVIHDRQVRFVLPLPDRADPEFTRIQIGRDGSSNVLAPCCVHSRDPRHHKNDAGRCLSLDATSTGGAAVVDRNVGSGHERGSRRS
jgi:hypothetical protein